MHYCDCKGTTKLQLLQRVFQRMLTKNLNIVYRKHIAEGADNDPFCYICLICCLDDMQAEEDHQAVHQDPEDGERQGLLLCYFLCTIRCVASY